MLDEYSKQRSTAYKARAYAGKGKFTYRKLPSKKTPYKTKTYSTGQFGQDPGTSDSKRTKSASKTATDVQSTRTLYWNDITIFDANTGSNLLNQRQRDTLLWTGTRVELEVANNTEEAMHFNVALVHTKNNLNPASTDFFRWYGTKRHQDFSVTLSSCDLATLPINTDKMVVLWHERHTLLPKNSGVTIDFNGQNGSSFKKISRWTPINRQLRFLDSSQNTPIDGQCFLVHWCDNYLKAGGSLPVIDALRIQYYVVNWFREPIQT